MGAFALCILFLSARKPLGQKNNVFLDQRKSGSNLVLELLSSQNIRAFRVH